MLSDSRLLLYSAEMTGRSPAMIAGPRCQDAQSNAFAFLRHEATLP